MATIKRLGIFWSQARCPIKFKVQVYNAVIRTKLTYGLEGAHMDPASNSKINALHLKGLRKILGMKQRTLTGGTQMKKYSEERMRGRN